MNWFSNPDCADEDYPGIFVRVDHPSVFSFIASVISDSASVEKETTYLWIIYLKKYIFFLN